MFELVGLGYNTFVFFVIHPDKNNIKLFVELLFMFLFNLPAFVQIFNVVITRNTRKYDESMIT